MAALTTTVACMSCRQLVRLEFAVLSGPPLPRLQPWICPYCWTKQEGTFHSLLMSATKDTSMAAPAEPNRRR